MASISQIILFLTALIIDVVLADNPFIQTIYTADPAPLVQDGRIYVFTGHDEDGATTFTMRDWHLFSTDDMANWQHHGKVLGLSDFSWAQSNAWAGHVISRNGKFYYYVPVTRRGGSFAIGVAVSDNITGPYRDAIGAPLIANGQIDPNVYIDPDDGQAYMYWGNPDLWYVRLNEDMVSFSGGVNKVSLTPASFGVRSGGPERDRPAAYEEGPWLYKHGGLWYLVYPANCCPEDIRYSTAPSPTGPWTYRGLVMASAGKAFTNHPGIVDFNGTGYFFYHNGALPGGGGYTRSVCVEEFLYGTDGSIPIMEMTTTGPLQLKPVDPYIKQEAEMMAWATGVKTEVCSEGGLNVAGFRNGNYIKVKGVAFGLVGAKFFSGRVSAAGMGGILEIRLGSPTGTLIGSCTVPGTGSWQSWMTVTCPIVGVEGTQDVFFRANGASSGSLFSLNWWLFQ